MGGKDDVVHTQERIGRIGRLLLKHIYVVSPKTDSPVATPTYLNVSLAVVALAVILLGVWPEPLLSLLNGLVAQL